MADYPQPSEKARRRRRRFFNVTPPEWSQLTRDDGTNSTRSQFLSGEIVVPELSFNPANQTCSKPTASISSASKTSSDTAKKSKLSPIDRNSDFVNKQRRRFIQKPVPLHENFIHWPFSDPLDWSSGSTTEPTLGSCEDGVQNKTRFKLDPVSSPTACQGHERLDCLKLN